MRKIPTPLEKERALIKNRNIAQARYGIGSPQYNFAVQKLENFRNPNREKERVLSYYYGNKEIINITMGLKQYEKYHSDEKYREKLKKYSRDQYKKRKLKSLKTIEVTL